jgi:xylulose-5-phosphate/fructose-6-phosphate phosphoketolase
MDNRELLAFFSGCGYQVCIVEDLGDIDADLNGALEWAVSEIRRIQIAARSGKPIMKPRWPLIILRTPKVRPNTIAGEIQSPLTLSDI